MIKTRTAGLLIILTIGYFILTTSYAMDIPGPNEAATLDEVNVSNTDIEEVQDFVEETLYGPDLYYYAAVSSGIGAVFLISFVIHLATNQTSF